MFDKVLRNLVAWSASVGGPKTKPSHLQAGRSYIAELRPLTINSTDVDQYGKLITALKTVLTQLERQVFPTTVTGHMVEVLKDVLQLLALQDEAKVRLHVARASTCADCMLHGLHLHLLPCMSLCTRQAHMLMEQSMFAFIADVFWKLIGSPGGTAGGGGLCSCRPDTCTCHVCVLALLPMLLLLRQQLTPTAALC